MSEQLEAQNDQEAWPLPSEDVRRELERRPLAWSEPEPELAAIRAA